MAAKPLTAEAIALTEKKMDMKLDDIIKMSQNTKARKQRRVPILMPIQNKSQRFSNSLTQAKFSKVQRYMESRSSLRQGVLAKKRSNFQGNQFPITAKIAQKVVSAPLRYRVPNRKKVASWNKARFQVPASQRRASSGGFVAEQPLPSLQRRQEDVNIMPKQRAQTLDSLFATMKEQRTRVLSRQNNAVQRNRVANRMPPWGRGQFGS